MRVEEPGPEAGRDEATTAGFGTARRPGRPRDPQADEAITSAIVDVLAEQGFSGFTVAEVAARAGVGKATIYRRWSTKEELVLAAAERVMVHVEPPDTGSLRGDLLAMRDSRARATTSDTDDALAGVWSVVQDEPEVAAIFHEQFVRSKVALMRGLLERARERGEIPADRDLDVVALVGPALLQYHKLANGGRLEEGFVERMVDEVIVPLATWGPGAPHA